MMEIIARDPEVYKDIMEIIARDPEVYKDIMEIIARDPFLTLISASDGCSLDNTLLRS